MPHMYRVFYLSLSGEILLTVMRTSWAKKSCLTTRPDISLWLCVTYTVCPGSRCTLATLLKPGPTTSFSMKSKRRRVSSKRTEYLNHKFKFFRLREELSRIYKAGSPMAFLVAERP